MTVTFLAYFIIKTKVVGTYYKHLNEMILISTKTNVFIKNQ